MFNKTKSPSPAAGQRREPSPVPPLPDLPSPSARNELAATPTVGGRGLSTLSADLQFAGDITGQGDLQVDSQVKGDIRVGRLIVGETGGIEGNVAADFVEVRGRIVGAVVGKQVKLVATAYVDGDISAEQLAIDIGAFFQGRVLQGSRQAPAAAAQPAPAAKPAPAAAPQVPDMKTGA